MTLFCCSVRVQVSALAASLVGDTGASAWGLALTYLPQLLPSFDTSALRSATVMSAVPAPRYDLAYGQYRLPITASLKVQVAVSSITAGSTSTSGRHRRRLLQTQHHQWLQHSWAAAGGGILSADVADKSAALALPSPSIPALSAGTSGITDPLSPKAAGAWAVTEYQVQQAQQGLMHSALGRSLLSLQAAVSGATQGAAGDRNLEHTARRALLQKQSTGDWCGAAAAGSSVAWSPDGSDPSQGRCNNNARMRRNTRRGE
jgi:hypothetical protein